MTQLRVGSCGVKGEVEDTYLAESSVWVEGLLVMMGESKVPWWVYKGASIRESAGCCKRPTVQVCVAVAVCFLTE